MSNNNNHKRPFTCYFCDQLIENETEMGHTTMCSKVLVPCPYKCGAYLERAKLSKHGSECNNNNMKKSTVNLDSNSNLSKIKKDISAHQTNSLGRKNLLSNNISNNLKMQEEISRLQRRFSEYENPATASKTAKSSDFIDDNVAMKKIDEVKLSVKEHNQSIQKFNYFMGFIVEWKKKIDSQLINFDNALKTVDLLKSECNKQQFYIQEKLIQLQNFHIDLNLLKDQFYKEAMRNKNVEIDHVNNLEEIRSTFNKQNQSFEKMWIEHTGIVQNILTDISVIKNDLNEQKAKYAGLVFDLRAVSQISSEAAENAEILERNFNLIKQEINQLKINTEILEDLTSSNEAQISNQRLVWRVTEVESKLKRAKENDIVLKSPIFYTHPYGYKMRVLLYINGLKKWKDRHALACFHILKGEYDPLLSWPCVIEGTITLKDLQHSTHQLKKDISKFIKIKRASGDEEEDEEPQESSSTYIFIPHTSLFKETYTKNDTFFLDINIKQTKLAFETNL